MSVVRLSKPETGDFAREFTRRNPEYCYGCGKPLRDITVLQNAGRAAFLFHPNCAREFALALLYDAQRAAAIERGQRLDAGCKEAVAA